VVHHLVAVAARSRASSSASFCLCRRYKPSRERFRAPPAAYVTLFFKAGAKLATLPTSRRAGKIALITNSLLAGDADFSAAQDGHGAFDMDRQNQTPAAPIGEGLKVLIIDDHKPHAETIAEILTDDGYECVLATSGEEGARQIDRDDFDVILTDLRMSGVDGL